MSAIKVPYMEQNFNWIYRAAELDRRRFSIIQFDRRGGSIKLIFRFAKSIIRTVCFNVISGLLLMLKKAERRIIFIGIARQRGVQEVLYPVQSWLAINYYVLLSSTSRATSIPTKMRFDSRSNDHYCLQACATKLLYLHSEWMDSISPPSLPYGD